MGLWRSSSGAMLASHCQGGGGNECPFSHGHGKYTDRQFGTNSGRESSTRSKKRANTRQTSPRKIDAHHPKMWQPLGASMWSDLPGCWEWGRGSGHHPRAGFLTDGGWKSGATIHTAPAMESRRWRSARPGGLREILCVARDGADGGGLGSLTFAPRELSIQSNAPGRGPGGVLREQRHGTGLRRHGGRRLDRDVTGREGATEEETIRGGVRAPTRDPPTL